MVDCPSPEHFELQLKSVMHNNEESSWIAPNADAKDEDEVNAMDTPFPLRIDSRNQKLIIKATEGVEEVGIYTFRLIAFAFDEIPDIGLINSQLYGIFDPF